MAFIEGYEWTPAGSGRGDGNQPFLVQVGEQVGEALRGLVRSDVIVLFEGGADVADGLALFQPLPDEAAGFVEGVVVRVAQVQQHGFVVEQGGDDVRVGSGLVASVNMG